MVAFSDIDPFLGRARYGIAGILHIDHSATIIFDKVELRSHWHIDPGNGLIPHLQPFGRSILLGICFAA